MSTSSRYVSGVISIALLFATVLLNIHDQIAEYSEGWTSKMAVPRSYYNWKEHLCRRGGWYKGRGERERRGFPPLIIPSKIRLVIGSVLASVAAHVSDRDAPVNSLSTS